MFGQITAVDLDQAETKHPSELKSLQNLKKKFERGVAGDESLANEIAEEWKKVDQLIQDPATSREALRNSTKNLRRLEDKAQQAKFENGFAYRDVPYIFDKEYDPAKTPERHWYSESVIDLTQGKFVSGYKDEKGQSTFIFGPSNSLLRAEALKVVLLLFGQSADEAKAGEEWQKPFLRKADELGLSVFHQNALEKITRGEMMNLIYELAVKEGALKKPKTHKDYLDVTVDDQYWEAFQSLYEIKVVQGQGGKQADLEGHLNRAEMAKIIHMMKQWRDNR